MAKFRDLTGHKFHRLTAIQRDGCNHNRESYWLCRCDCGNMTRVIHSSLTHSGTKSCGCLQRERRGEVATKDFTGVRSGWLVAVRPTGARDAAGNHLWLCQCDCGNTKEVRGSKIKTGIVVSCGCARKNRTALRDPAIRADRLTRQARRRSTQIGAEGAFTEEEVQALYRQQDGCCVYCKTILNDGFHRDHVKPLSKGGSNWISNIQLLCPPCNTRKNDKLHEHFAAQIGFVDDLL